jgi:hypothetical protein
LLRSQKKCPMSRVKATRPHKLCHLDPIHRLEARILSTGDAWTSFLTLLSLELSWRTKYCALQQKGRVRVDSGLSPVLAN